MNLEKIILYIFSYKYVRKYLKIPYFICLTNYKFIMKIYDSYFNTSSQ